MGGGGSGRVIGSRVTHTGVNDSDMSNNQRNAWSASRSSVSQREGISGAVTRRCCSRSAQASFHNSCVMASTAIAACSRLNGLKCYLLCQKINKQIHFKKKEILHL